MSEFEALSKVLKKAGDAVAIWCPGCKAVHVITTSGPRAWGWNGNVDQPTFTPSLLVRTGHYVPGHTKNCWCTYRAEHPEVEDDEAFHCSVCHSYITNGRILFLSDCTHALAGQTVDLPEWPK
jgi:hypothetical protein